jgi:RNA-directed DNA polymerase
MRDAPVVSGRRVPGGPASGVPHPAETLIVYCKDDDWTGRRLNGEVRFPWAHVPASLGEESAGRVLRELHSGREQRCGDEDATGDAALANPLWSDKAIDDLARMWNAVLRGWIEYYGRFYRSALYSTFRHFNELLTRWAMRKYKRLRGHRRRAEQRLGGLARREPRLFAHWHLLGVKPAAG